jgi:hypothetical protein
VLFVSGAAPESIALPGRGLIDTRTLSTSDHGSIRTGNGKHERRPRAQDVRIHVGLV